MDYQKGKDKVVEEYCSQPVTTSRWSPIKWRRLNLGKTGLKSGDNSCNPEDGKINEEDHLEKRKNKSTETKDDQQLERKNERKKRTFIFATEQHKEWSDDVLRFYTDGDSEFCYSRFLGYENKLDGGFWGTLLGFEGNGRLTQLHIEGWVRRTMEVRNAKAKRASNEAFPWTVLPPQFYHSLHKQHLGKGTMFTNGSISMYPPIWEVRYVYIPLYVESVNEWMLSRLDLYKMELTQFWTNHSYSANYKKYILRPVFHSFSEYFRDMCNQIGYFQNYKGPFIEYKFGRWVNVNIVSEEYMPPKNVDLGDDSGVFLCMLLHHLTEGKITIDMHDDIKKKYHKFRMIMAGQFYKTRVAPEESSGT